MMLNQLPKTLVWNTICTKLSIWAAQHTCTEQELSSFLFENPGTITLQQKKNQSGYQTWQWYYQYIHFTCTILRLINFKQYNTFVQCDKKLKHKLVTLITDIIKQCNQI